MPPLVVRNARLFDGTGTDGVPGVTIIAGDDGRILYAGAAAAAPPEPGDAVEIDAEGRSLIPGLIDCHVHLCFDGTVDFMAEAEAMDAAEAARKAERNARRALEAGITTVRDLGGKDLTVIEVARALVDGEGARVVAAGPVLTVTGGHGHFFGFGRAADSAEDLEAAVRELAAAGAGVIKIVATGGVLTKGVDAQRSAYTVEQIAAVVAAAHDAGLRVAAHAIGAEGIVAALEGGVDSVEHGCFLTDRALELLTSGDRWLVPTLSAPERMLHGGEGVPDYAIAKSKEVAAAHTHSIGRAADAGARIASGTDAGTPYNHHGGLARELGLMAEAGVPLPMVLRSATAEAAALLGLEDCGVVAPGRRADCVLLDGDPLDDVTAYERAALVAQGGDVVVDRR